MKQMVSVILADSAGIQDKMYNSRWDVLCDNSSLIRGSVGDRKYGMFDLFRGLFIHQSSIWRAIPHSDIDVLWSERCQ